LRGLLSVWRHWPLARAKGCDAVSRQNGSAAKTFRRRGTVSVPKVTLAHGAGGKAMRDLIDDVFVSCFDNPLLANLDDQARLSLSDLARDGDRLAFTTDSYVVDPLEFPGGDIGKLAVAGTINDLAVGGARPLHLSCAVIIEEGIELDLLRRLARSMAATAAAADVTIITGDTKVVGRGDCDKLFITTTGIGVIRAGLDTGPHQIRPGDSIIFSGRLGDHGAAIDAGGWQTLNLCPPGLGCGLRTSTKRIGVSWRTGCTNPPTS